MLQSIHGSETLSEPWVEAATRAWLLQRLARTFSPPAQIVRRARGMPLDAQCERVTEPDAPGFGNRVYLVTMPGFKVGGVVVSKCLVYPDFRPVEAPVTQPGIAPVFRSAENAPGAQQKAAPVFRSAEIAPGAQQKAAPVFDEATKATAGQTSGERKDSLGLPPNEYVQWSENPSFQSASVIDSPRQGVSPGDVTGMALDGPDLEGVVDESAGQSGTGKVHVSPHVISDDFGKDTSAYR